MSDTDESIPPKKRKCFEVENLEKKDTSKKCIKCGISRKKINSVRIKKILDQNDKSKYEKLLNKIVYIGDFMSQLSCKLKFFIQH